ncbi:DUF4253 domain-containing protein [Kitasatospora sp. NPDC097643]|uniref:DUF4253 domain-containing protein n=1 Tax=Kitasatospora sp. NPDC097643 TaxID=3157230 RepID=UPI00332B52D9
MTWPFDVSPPVPLPPGRSVVGDEGRGQQPLLWVSDERPPAGLWGQLHRAHPQSGLYPLLLAPLADEPDFRPWLSGELFPALVSDPAHHDPAALLRGWWEGPNVEDEEEDEDDFDPVLAPYDATWPGLAADPVPLPCVADAGECARILAAGLEADGGRLRLGLVRAAGGAAALAACGWNGPVNHENDTAKIAAVLASWERRFGARVVQAGFDTLELSVAAPPATLDEALPLAAEHTALCPDLVFQGTGTLTAYAELLVAFPRWSFWWD